jgi:ABC-type antimicrobial peptide transport system permease subunit
MGALPGQVVRLVLGDGLRLTSWGMGLGLLVAVPLSAFMRAQAGDIAPISIPSVLGGAALLSVAVAVAILVPARRANRIDPVEALRED